MSRNVTKIVAMKGLNIDNIKDFGEEKLIGVWALVVRNVLHLWSLIVLSRLLSIWHGIVKFTSRNLVSCYHMCDSVQSISNKKSN